MPDLRLQPLRVSDVDEGGLEVRERIRAFAIPSAVGGVSATWLRQRGVMWQRPGGPAMAFSAEQHIDGRALAFRWTAHFRVAGVLPLTVIDAFEGRHGYLEVRPLGIRVSRSAGAEFDVGEAQRLLAELPWCPYALDHPELQWTGVDASRVRVALGEAEVTLEVDGDGRVLRAHALRLAQVAGGFERRAWRGEFGEYREFEGMRLPSSARVFWDLADGPFEYFRCDVVDAGVAGIAGVTSEGRA